MCAGIQPIASDAWIGIGVPGKGDVGTKAGDGQDGGTKGYKDEGGVGEAVAHGSYE